MSNLQNDFTSRLWSRGWRTGLVALSIAAFFSVAGAAGVEKIPALLAKPKVLCGNFEQTKQLTGLRKPLISSGRFCVVSDKGVLWRTLQPFPNTVRVTRQEITQTQGERVTMRLNAEQEPALGVINSVLFSLLAADFGPLEKLFELDGKVIKNRWSVKLKARDPGLARMLGTISLDGGAYVTGIGIEEANGDRTSITFSAIQTGDDAMSRHEAEIF